MGPDTMTKAPFPDSSELTREDFIRSGWREVLDNSPMNHFRKACDAFGKASVEARENGNIPRAKVLFLLATVCSMRLNNNSPSEPFAPIPIANGQSLPVLDSFSASDINLLTEIIDEVDMPMLRGQIADILWIRKVPGGYRFALEAIDNYRSLDLNQDTWVTDIGKRWKRSLILSRMLVLQRRIANYVV